MAQKKNSNEKERELIFPMELDNEEEKVLLEPMKPNWADEDVEREVWVEENFLEKKKKKKEEDFLEKKKKKMEALLEKKKKKKKEEEEEDFLEKAAEAQEEKKDEEEEEEDDDKSLITKNLKMKKKKKNNNNDCDDEEAEERKNDVGERRDFDILVGKLEELTLQVEHLKSKRNAPPSTVADDNAKKETKRKNSSGAVVVASENNRNYSRALAATGVSNREEIVVVGVPKKKYDKVRIDVDFSTLTAKVYGHKDDYGYVVGHRQANIKYLHETRRISLKVPSRDKKTNEIEIVPEVESIHNLNYGLNKVLEYLYAPHKPNMNQ